MADQRDERTGSGEFAIGFGDDGPSEYVAELAGQVDTTIEGIARDTADIRDLMFAGADASIADINAVVGEVAGIIQGGVDRRLDFAQDVIDRLYQRVDSAVQQRIEDISITISDLLDVYPPPAGLDMFGSVNQPTETQCQFDPRLPGCYNPNADTALPADTGPTIILPGGDGGGGLGDVTIPPGGGGGGGGGSDWPVLIACGPGYLPQIGKIVESKNGIASKIQTHNGQILPTDGQPPNSSGIYFTPSPSDCIEPPTAPTETGCVKLCQPICGPTSPTPTTPAKDPFDNAGGSTPFSSCTVADDSITINEPGDGSVELPFSDYAEQFNNGAVDAPLNQPPAQPNPTAAGQCGAPPELVDFVFIATCGPENWEAAKAGFDALQLPRGQSADQLFTNIQQQIEQSADAIKVDGWLATALKWAFTFAVSLIVAGFGVITSVILAIIPIPKACQQETTAGMMTFQALIRFGQRWLGIVPRNVMLAMDQSINYSCQVGIPSTAELSAQRLAGVITSDEWDYGCKLNGDCPAWFERSYEGGLAVPTIQQAFSLWRGGLIDEERFRFLLKRNRIPTDSPIFDWKKLTEQLPGPGELMRFMTRDVADHDAVEFGCLDDNFDDKWKDTIKDWGERQGLTEEIARNHWRAHWLSPSPTQLLSFYHRLRPGLPISNVNGKDIQFTRNDLAKALKLNDLMPAYVDRVIATSSPPIAISYLRILYQTGVLSEQDLIPRFMDLGYVGTDAEKLAKGFALSMVQQRSRYLGGYEPQVARKDFIDFGLSEQYYRQVLEQAGFTGDDVTRRVESAKLEQQAKSNVKLRREARSAYFNGRIDVQEYQKLLQDLGLENEIITTILTRDTATRNWKYRPLRIQQMCKLVKQGILSPDDYIKMATNFGYSPEVAQMFAQSCNQDVMEARMKEINASLREAARVAERELKRQAKIQRAVCRAERAATKCRINPTPACEVDTAPPPCGIIGVGA